MYKLIAFDIDGTILPKGEIEFTSKVKDMFKELKKKNLITVFCTGREFVSIGEMIHTKNIDYFIGANGTFIYNMKSKEIMYENAAKYEDYKKLEIFCEKEGFNLSVMTKTSAYFKDKHKYENNWFWGQFYDLLKPLDSESLKEDPIHQITIRIDQPKDMVKVQKFVKQTQGLAVNTVFSAGLFVAATGVNKAKGLEILGKKIGIKLSEMIAFGDGENDHEMIAEVGCGIAMGQASKGLKDKAFDIADTCENDGTIKKLIEMEILK